MKTRNGVKSIALHGALGKRSTVSTAYAHKGVGRLMKTLLLLLLLPARLQTRLKPGNPALAPGTGHQAGLQLMQETTLAFYLSSIINKDRNSPVREAGIFLNSDRHHDFPRLCISEAQ